MSLVKKASVRLTTAPWYSGFNVLVGCGEGNYATNITFEKIKDGEIIEPSLTIDFESAQVLFNDMWSAGLRPTDGTGSIGQLHATEKHLEDMRRLVFKNSATGE